MAITGFDGPLIGFGQTISNSTDGLTGTVPPGSYNSQRGPSLWDLGSGMMDPRPAYQYTPGTGPSAMTFGFPHGMGQVDLIVSSGSSNAFWAQGSTLPTAGAAITLATASSAKATYTTTIIAPETGQTSETLIAIDSTAASVTFSQDGTVAYWNPAAGSGRCVTFTATAADGGTWKIIGRDMYGYRMTEYLTVGTSTIRTQKAFKYISSIIAATTINSSSVSIGLSETFGFPLRADYMGPNTSIALTSNQYTFSGYNVVTSSAADPFAPAAGNVILGSTAVTATATTADPRGTYTSSTALAIANNQRLLMNFRPTVAQLSATSSTSFTAMFGHQQFYSSI